MRRPNAESPAAPADELLILDSFCLIDSELVRESSRCLVQSIPFLLLRLRHPPRDQHPSLHTRVSTLPLWPTSAGTEPLLCHGHTGAAAAVLLTFLLYPLQGYFLLSALLAM